MSGSSPAIWLENCSYRCFRFGTSSAQPASAYRCQMPLSWSISFQAASRTCYSAGGDGFEPRFSPISAGQQRFPSSQVSLAVSQRAHAKRSAS